MEIREVKAKKGHYFTNTVTLTIDTDKGTHRITGSLFDRKEAKIVSLDHFMQVGASKDKNTNIMAVAIDKDIPSAILPVLANIDGIHGITVIHCESH